MGRPLPSDLVMLDSVSSRLPYCFFLCSMYHCFNVSNISVVLLFSVTGIVVSVNKICFIYKIYPFQCTKILLFMFDLSLFYVPKLVVLCTQICFYHVPTIVALCAELSCYEPNLVLLCYALKYFALRTKCCAFCANTLRVFRTCRRQRK